MQLEPVEGNASDEEDSSDWLRGWNAATAEALPEVQELEQVCHSISLRVRNMFSLIICYCMFQCLEELRHERSCKRISVFQTMHTICHMKFESRLPTNQVANLMDTVTRLEEIAKLCVPHDRSKWTQRANELHERVGTRKKELMSMRDLAHRVSAAHMLCDKPGSLPDVSIDGEASGEAEVKVEPVEGNASDE